MANGNISGKVNIPVSPIIYEGETTPTAEVVVDNKDKLISVNVDVDYVTKDCGSKDVVDQLVIDVDYLSEHKQDRLVSGENIKTINGTSVLGPGNIEVIAEYCFSADDTIDELYSKAGEKAFLYICGGDGRHIANIHKEENIYTVKLWAANLGFKNITNIEGFSTLDNIHYNVGEWVTYVTSDNIESDYLNSINSELQEHDADISYLNSEVGSLDNRITKVEHQVRVYNYFYPENSESPDTIALPIEDTTYNLLEFSSKGLFAYKQGSADEDLTNCYVRVLQGDEPYYIDSSNAIKQIFNAQDDFSLYQTGIKADMSTSRYAYDTIDFDVGNIIRYCYPITFKELFTLFSASDFTWSTASNGRLSIRHDRLATQGIYTENNFVLKYTRDIGLTYRGIGTANFGIENLLALQGVTNKATAISVLSGDDFDDVKIIFKRTEPLVEHSPQINVLVPAIDCNGADQVIIHNFNGCIKASYLSLYSLVYSKEQSDDKFQTIAGYVEQYTSNDHIVKIGDLADNNKIIASTAIYTRLSDMGWPKVASAYCVEPASGEEYTGDLIPQFTHDTLFINSFDGTNYGYIVLSNKNLYWFRVDSRTGILTLESMLGDEVKNDNIMNGDNDSLVQVSHFNTGLTWSSDDESVATVDQEGKVTAISAGTAVISVIDEDGRTAECQVTVTTPTRQLNSRKGLLKGVAPQGTQYRLVSDVSNLSDGDSIIIAAMKSADNSWYALSTTQNSNNRAVAAISVPADDIITITSNDVEEITLESTGQTNEFNLAVTNGYLYAASSSSNYLRTRLDAGSDGNANWLLDIVNNEASIVAQGNYTRNTLRAYLSGSSPVFSCYAGASNVPVRIYKKVEGPEPPESVTITGTSGTLTIGTSVSLSASVIPVTASQEVTWSTSDSSIISVTSDGEITAEGEIGESADITATCVEDTSISDTVTITITEIPTVITSVTVTPSSVSGLSYGETVQLEAEVIGTGPGVTQEVTWTSGDEDMAAVDDAGLVTIGNKPGNAIIVATSDVDPSVSGSCTVSVEQVMVSSIEIDPNTPTELTVGLDSDPINYTISPSYAYDKSVEWSSSDTSKATVNNGVVSALEVTDEPVIITVSALDGSGESDSISITIVEPLGRLYFDVEELSLKVGETYKLICSDKPFNIATGRTSAAFGSGNDVENEDSFALGSHLASTADNQTLVGKYNDTSSTAVFQVGAGDVHAGFNAFEVSASGKAKVGTATQSSDSANTLVTKGFADVTYVAKTRVSSILTSDWTNSSVTLSLSPVVVGSADVLFVTPTDDCAQEYYDCGIQRTISQDGTSITLSAVTIPENTITIQIIYFKGQGF